MSPVRVRPDGTVEYRCPECGKPLIRANFLLSGGQWVQAMCKWCGKERRFKAGEET